MTNRSPRIRTMRRRSRPSRVCARPRRIRFTENEGRSLSSGDLISERQASASGAADESEIDDLLRLARSLAPRPPEFKNALNDLIAKTTSELETRTRPIERERIAERFGRALRQLWLDASAFVTSSS